MLGISILFLFCGGWMAALTELVLAALTYGAGLLLEKLRTKKSAVPADAGRHSFGAVRRIDRPAQ